MTAGSKHTIKIARPEDLRALSKPVRELRISRDKKPADELHAWFQGLTGLQTLNLSECPGLTGLPEEWLGGLTGLRTLELVECPGLTGLPESLGGLTGLQTLDLEGCSGLTGLPESLLPLRSRLGGTSADSFDALIGRGLAAELERVREALRAKTSSWRAKTGSWRGCGCKCGGWRCTMWMEG